MVLVISDAPCKGTQPPVRNDASGSRKVAWMRPRALGAAALTIAAVMLLAVEISSWSQSARFGPSIGAGSRCTPEIISADPKSAPGLQSGDKILLPQMNLPARLAISYRSSPVQTGRAGETIALRVARGDRNFTTAYRLQHDDSRLTFGGQLGFKLFLLVVGVFVLWRGRDRASLLLGIWCLDIAIALPDAWWGALSPQGRLAGGVVSAGLWTAGAPLLYLVIEAITRNVSRRVIVLTRFAVVATTLPAFFDNTINAAAQTETGCKLLPLPLSIVSALFVTTQLVILGFFILSYSRSVGVQRQRVRWVFWAFLISRFGVLLNLMNRLPIVTHPIQLSGVEWLTVLIFPLGCAYAILRHRIIDVNFVLNRTLVYTILTTIAVGIFVLLENLLTKVAAGRGISLAVELCVALGLGFSFNALLKKTENVIERTLFRRKYEAARSLQRFCEEAGFMENADALLAQATKEIPRAVGASGAAFYERFDGSYRLIASSGGQPMPGEVGVDDPAFVRLRKHLSQVDLSGISSALGERGVAFALPVRGKLFGALLCGDRVDDETYAPDEIMLLRNVAHEVGAELHAIRARQRAELLDALMTGSIDLSTARARLADAGTPAVG